MANSKTIRIDSETVEIIEKIKEEYRLKGLVLKDSQVIKHALIMINFEIENHILDVSRPSKKD